MTATTGTIEVVTAPTRTAFADRLRAIRVGFTARRRTAALAEDRTEADAARMTDTARLFAERERTRAFAEAARVQRLL